MNRLGASVMSGLLTLIAAGSALAQEPGVSRKEADATKGGLERQGKVVEHQPWSASEGEDEERWYDKIHVAIGATGVLQGPAGAKERLSPRGNASDGSASYELELRFRTGERGLAYLHLEAGDGNGIDADIPALSCFNGDADGDGNVRFTEFWYARRFDNLGAVLEMGKLCFGGPGDNAPDDAILFDGNEYANNERSQFLSGAFINSPSMEFPDDNGLGAMVRVSPDGLLDVSAGIADADANWENVFEGVFSIVELDLKPKVAARRGNYRVYAWLNGKDHEDLRDSAGTKESNYGFGLSLDQEITNRLGLFARYGWQRGSVSRIERTWSAGLQCSARGFGGDGDVFGLACGEAIIGEAWKDLARAGGVNTGDERRVELYYNLRANEHLTICPDIQWVRNPGGDRDNGDVWAFGIRVQFSS